jgi:hypothetical protein
VSVSPLSMHLSPAPEPSRTQDKGDSSQGLYQGRATFPLSSLPLAAAPRMRPHTEPGQSLLIPAETVLFHKAPRLAAYDRPERTVSALPVRATAPALSKVILTPWHPTLFAYTCFMMPICTYPDLSTSLAYSCLSAHTVMCCRIWG